MFRLTVIFLFNTPRRQTKTPKIEKSIYRHEFGLVVEGIKFSLCCNKWKVIDHENVMNVLGFSNSSIPHT
jgi:hypothetical protein